MIPAPVPGPYPDAFPTAYRIADQFGRTHDRAETAGRPVLFVVADRQGTDALAAWAGGLRALVEGQAAGGPASRIAVVPVVQIPGVPSPFRGAVRRLLPRDPSAWTLVDFDGALAALAEPDAHCTVALVDAAGALLARVGVAAYEADQAADLVRRAAAPPSA
jgi:hypothetical protein